MATRAAVALPVVALAGSPNILFFLADDMGYGDAGYLSTAPADRRLLTPNMDRMVKQGTAFTDVYAGAPVCAPSRCTLITGRHSGHCTVRSNGPMLGKEDVGVAQVLRDAGYRTVHIGKWGLGTMTNDGSPMAKGFDEYYGQTDQAYCHDYYPSYMDSNRNVSRQQDLKEYLPENAKASAQACGEDHKDCLWSGDEWTTVAVDWLTRAGERQQAGSAPPFFMYLSYTAPHAGGIGTNNEGQPPVPRVSTGPYASRSDWGKEVGYATAVTNIDTKLGVILDTLKDSQLAQNTVLFFSSDNGASNEGNHNYDFFASSGPLKGFKRSLHEGGHRAPMIVTWPGHIPGGKLSGRPWGFWDFLATAADLAGIPAKHLPQQDGLSVLPTLLGEKQDYPPFIYHEYCQPNENKLGWGQHVRLGNWSAVCVGDSLKSGKVPACDTPLLYDLSSDIGQTTDIAAKHADVVKIVMRIMTNEHEYNDYCGAVAPSAKVSLADLEGDWLQQSSGKPAMRVDVANVTDESCSVSVKCVEPCTCCSWKVATGTASIADGSVSLKITAMDPASSFTTHEVGALTAMQGSETDRSLTLAWSKVSSGDHSWAKWTRKANDMFLV